jgi:hypothetical protein
MQPLRSRFVVRFRSADRDRSTDKGRMQAIQKAVSEALVAAERERRMLTQRLEEARIGATLLAGTDTYEYETRQPEEAAELGTYEVQMRRAEQRLKELDQQLARLRQIERTLLDGVLVEE